MHYADPDSAAPGIFAGLDISWDGCVRGTPGIAGDSDLDAVDDYCEEVLADLFRPMLATSDADEGLSMEPYFASDSATTPGVLGVSTEGPAVRVFYLLSYHFDGGSPNPACPPSPGYDECAAHFGDSEFVELYLRYHRFTKHWLVAGALMSAHFQSGGVFEWAIDSSQWYGPSQLEFPGKSLAYPRVWVSRDKHANYNTQANCDSGAAYFDTCDDNNDSGRIRHLGDMHNVGSSSVQFVDSTKSRSAMAFDGVEYFWTAVNFCGWDESSASSSRIYCGGRYGEYLTSLGY